MHDVRNNKLKNEGEWINEIKLHHQQEVDIQKQQKHDV
jgi:hypothetical protein